MKKKIFRVTEEDEADLSLLVTLVREYYYLTGIRGKNSARLPNESNIIRALIRLATEVASEASAKQRAELRGEKLSPDQEPIDRDKIMIRLFEDGHLETKGVL